MLSRAWTVIYSLVFPWEYASSHRRHSRIQSDHEGSPPRKRLKHAASPEPLHCHDPRHLSPLEAVNVDVFRLIADELYNQGDSLHNLSLSSRKLRYLSNPLLFARCKWMVLSRWDFTAPLYLYAPSEDPPETIRPFVRHLRIRGSFQYNEDVEQFHSLLGYFPSISSVTFSGTRGLVPWPAIKSCLVNPHLTSLLFDAADTDRFNSPPYPSDGTTCTASSLKRLSLTTTMWREHANVTSTTRYRVNPRDMNEVYRLERDCLTAILLTMNNTATSLTLPMEAAPLQEMLNIPWLQLRHLCLHGRFLDDSQSTALQALLPYLPSLETLSVQAARPTHLGRPRLLSNSPSSSRGTHHASTTSADPSHDLPTLSTSPTTLVERPATPPAILPSLRSLTVAYPNPEDDIFSINANLTHLSIRDCPRFYNFLAYGERIGPQWGWNNPILTPAQCLSILKRMALPELTSLELVYMVPGAGWDNNLLMYVSQAFPALSHLEIHRYRLHRTERVDYVHIARTLAAAKSLRTVRLNLDFHDDHQAYCGNPQKRQRWRETLMGQRGPEILAIMQECPLLEHVALLYHGNPSSTWVEFRTPCCPGLRVVLKYDSEHVDSEPLKKQWLTM